MLHFETERKIYSIKNYDFATCSKEKELTTGCRQYEYDSLNEFISDNSGMEDALNKHPALNEFISFDKNDGLTHVVVDNNPNRPEFLKDVFYNEEKFPYLIKIYDSSKQGYDYHLKIFKIDYEIFDSIK